MLFWEKIPAREHYLLRLLTHLAGTYGRRKSLSLADIAAEEGLSVKYLEKLIAPLKQVGWVRAARGRQGGYLMVKNPARLSLYDLVQVYQKESQPLVCLGDTGGCCLAKHCPSKVAWQQLLQSWEKVLRQYKLSKFLV